MICEPQQLPLQILENVCQYLKTADLLAFAGSCIEASRNFEDVTTKWIVPLTINANVEHFEEVPIGWSYSNELLRVIDLNCVWSLKGLTLNYVLPVGTPLNFSLSPFEKLRLIWDTDLTSVETVNINIDLSNVPKSLANLGTVQLLNISHVLTSFPNLLHIKVSLERWDASFVHDFGCSLDADLLSATFPLQSAKFYHLNVTEDFLENFVRVCPNLQAFMSSGAHFTTCNGSDRKLSLLSQVKSLKEMQLSSWYEEYLRRDEINSLDSVRVASLRIDSVESVNRFMTLCPNLVKLSVTGSNAFDHPKVPPAPLQTLSWDSFRTLTMLELKDFPVHSFELLGKLPSLDSLKCIWMCYQQAETQLQLMSDVFEARSESRYWSLKHLIIELELDTDFMTDKLNRKLQKASMSFIKTVQSRLKNLQVFVMEFLCDNRFYALDIDTGSLTGLQGVHYARINQSVCVDCDNALVWNDIIEMERTGWKVRLCRSQ